MVLALAAVGLVALSAAEEPLPRSASALVDLIRSLPGILESLWQVAADALVLLAVLVVAASLYRRRWSVARDCVVALGVTVVVGMLAHHGAVGGWDVWHGLGSAAAPPRFPAMRVALPASAVLTASPHLALPMRRLGHWVIGVAALAVAMVSATSPLGSVAGVLIATISAAVVHLGFGSSAGRPSLDLVRTALGDLGVSISTLGAADRQPAGYFLVDARDAEGNDLDVKVYGRDAHDAALVSTVWRTVWYREPDSPLRFGRLQQVEHEAFLTLFAGQQQVTPNGVVTAGSTVEDDAILVLRRNGVRLADLPVADDLAELVDELWALVGRLGRSGMAHGQVDDHHIVVHQDRLGLQDFRGATMSPTEIQRRSDEVQAFVTVALLAGPDAAIASAASALGADGLGAILPYLQPPALTDAQRKRVRADEHRRR